MRTRSLCVSFSIPPFLSWLVYRLFCVLYLRYRGFESDPIPPNVTRAGLLGLMQSDFGPCLSCHAGATGDPMHVFPAIQVSAPSRFLLRGGGGATS